MEKRAMDIHSETVEAIIEEMRNRTDLDGRDMVDNFSLDAEFGERGGYDALKLIRAYADRIKAAHDREVAVSKTETTTKESLAVGNTAKMREALSDACYAMFNFLKTQYGGFEEMAKALDKAKAALAEPPEPIGNAAKLREAIAKCVNLITEFGNAEIIKTPLDVIIDIEAILKAALAAPPEPIGNNAKTREALKYLRDASREFCHLILNSKHNEIFDKYKHAEVAKIRDAIANADLVLAAPPEPVGNAAKMREAIDRCVTLITEFGNAEILKTPLDVIIDIEVILKVALAATPRNCDRFENFDKAQKSFLRETGSLVVGEEMFDWLFAEAKGETK